MASPCGHDDPSLLGGFQDMPVIRVSDWIRLSLHVLGVCRSPCKEVEHDKRIISPVLRVVDAPAHCWVVIRLVRRTGVQANEGAVFSGAPATPERVSVFTALGELSNRSVAHVELALGIVLAHDDTSNLSSEYAQT